MSQGPMSTSPSKGGRFQPQQGYQRQPMPSPGGKGGSAGGSYGGQNPRMQQPMQSPGSKGGQSRFPVQTQPYPMPSPGGKGGSYQRQQMPFGYGQTTFSPGQFGGYGVPSNAFSFNNPNYQPYMPPTYDSGQTGQSPDIGNNPMSPQPEVMTGQQVSTLQASPASTLQAPPDIYQDKIVDPRDAFTPPGGFNPSMPFGGKGGGRSVFGQPMSGYAPPSDYDPDAIRVFDPYGEGGDLEGQPRPTFPDPTQPQGPQNLQEMFGFNFGGTPSGGFSNRSGLFNSQALTDAILQQQTDGRIQQAQSNQEGLRRVFNRPLVPIQSPQQPVGIAGLMGRPGYGNQYPFR